MRQPSADSFAVNDGLSDGRTPAPISSALCSFAARLTDWPTLEARTDVSPLRGLMGDRPPQCASSLLKGTICLETGNRTMKYEVPLAPKSVGGISTAHPIAPSNGLPPTMSFIPCAMPYAHQLYLRIEYNGLALASATFSHCFAWVVAITGEGCVPSLPLEGGVSR